VETNQVRVQSSPTRCPFCHDTCQADGEDVVCHDCLARHHAECWGENGACAACSSPKALVAQEPSAASTPDLRSPPARIGLSDAELESLVSRQRWGGRLRVGGALLLAAALILMLWVLDGQGGELPRWTFNLFFSLCGSGVLTLALGTWLAGDPKPRRARRDP